MYHVIKYTRDNQFVSVIAGMGRNRGSWDAGATTLSTAMRWARQCRRDEPDFVFIVEETFGGAV